MRCRTCDYPLWNLSTRACPECGDAFAPSQYAFKPNSVEFRCPHCAQPYYGTSADGHLEPRLFECVRCHARIDMDEMVLVPAQGVDPDRVVREHHPWINRAHTGRRHGWWRTSILGMVNPVQLARVTPPDAPLAPAWKFTALNFLFVIGLSYLMIVAFGLLGAVLLAAGSQGGPGVGSFMLIVLGGYGVLFLAILIVQLFFTAIWILITHAFLKITGGAEHTVRATALSILYTSGAYLPNLIPCVNYVSWLWWPITAGIMLKDMQGVAAWRAITAALLTPILTVVGFVIAYAAIITWSISIQNTAMVTARTNALQAQQTNMIWLALNQYASAAGSYPEHALLAIASGDLNAGSLIHPSTRTTLADVPAGDMNLDEFEQLGVQERLRVAQDAADAMPEGVVAHRLGDVVFTAHGFTPGTDMNLWIAIISPDPDANPGQSEIDGLVWVCLASGARETFTRAEFDRALERQNALRASHDLAPLPPPSQVHAAAPAAAP